jgi:hypothetical protein
MSGLSVRAFFAAVWPASHWHLWTGVLFVNCGLVSHTGARVRAPSAPLSQHSHEGGPERAFVIPCPAFNNICAVLGQLSFAPATWESSERGWGMLRTNGKLPPTYLSACTCLHEYLPVYSPSQTCQQVYFAAGAVVKATKCRVK